MLTELPPNATFPLCRSAAPQEDLSDVGPETSVILKVPLHSDFGVVGYAQSFRPHVKILLVRHPAHVIAGLRRAKPGAYKQVPEPHLVAKRLDRAYQGSGVKYDAILVYEEIVWNRVIAQERFLKLGFPITQVTSSQACRLPSAVCCLLLSAVLLFLSYPPLPSPFFLPLSHHGHESQPHLSHLSNISSQISHLPARR